MILYMWIWCSASSRKQSLFICLFTIITYFSEGVASISMLYKESVEKLFYTGEGDVSKDWGEQFDASIGLSVSLRAFEIYRKRGTLSAEIRSVPGIRGRCQAYLELTQGKVVSCYLMDRIGDRHRVTKEWLVQLDEEKGPFGWVFHASADATFAMPSQEKIPKQSLPSFPVPMCLVPQLDVRQLQRWTPQQQRCLYMVFSMVDGQRSIDEIKARVSLPTTIVDEVIHILLLLGAIAMQ
jgi:hypothetical protein